MSGLLIAAAAASAWSQSAVTLETPRFRYVLSTNGANLAFVDLNTGTNYLRSANPSVCALVRREGREYPVTAVARTADHLHLRFGTTGIEADVRVETQPSFLRLTVDAVRGGEIESLVFLNVPLTVKGVPADPFGACAFSLNLQTRVDQLPVLQSELRAAGHAKFGIIGAQAAIVAGPVPTLLPALKELLEGCKAMPLCRVAGPWAQEIPFNHGSYLFNFGSLTETNVTDWIEMTRRVGVTQIDNHGGGAGFFRFGDFELNREKWPEGWESFARIVAQLHAAGIGSIFHTYAFFIDKQSKYVAPVPDARLDAFRTFTLAEPLTTEADSVTVTESTAGMTTVTGFFEHNSVVLHLGDELVTFGGVSTQAPWRFTGLKRGAHGTKPAAHPVGTRARHLKECFGLFVPDVDSSLFEEIAANHAAIVNRCGFDAIYLDAIDGSSILRGGEECWYWADKFVFEIQKRLNKPVGMEMSAMWHHFWQYRTRWQAWDYPQRGHRRFIDLHAESVNGGLLLPLHLGWWNFQSFNPPQIEPTYPEVIEYLGAKLIGWDAGISLTGAINRDQLRTVPLFRRAVDVLRTCEELRHSRTLDDRVKAELRQPGQEFALVAEPGQEPRFQRARSEAHTVAVSEPWTLAWRVTNAFAAQPVRFRLEALMSTGPLDDPKARMIGDLARTNLPGWKSSAARGGRLVVTPDPAGGESAVAELTASSEGQVPRNGAWVRVEQRFEPLLSLKEHQGLGLWVEGDGQGALLAIRLESPRHVAFGAVADRYIPLDFSGRRALTLVETESSRWSDYVWDDGKGAYNVYRETIDFGAVESMTVWLQNLPAGKEVKCRVSPIRALPLITGTVKDPTVRVNGVSLLFPVELRSGSWIEYDGHGDARVYGAKGEELGTVTPRGETVSYRAGANDLEFSCVSPAGPSPRAKLTVFFRGPDI